MFCLDNAVNEGDPRCSKEFVSVLTKNFSKVKVANKKGREVETQEVRTGDYSEKLLRCEYHFFCPVPFYFYFFKFPLCLLCRIAHWLFDLQLFIFHFTYCLHGLSFFVHSS